LIFHFVHSSDKVAESPNTFVDPELQNKEAKITKGPRFGNSALFFLKRPVIFRLSPHEESGSYSSYL
jgi:hypothetical protein